MFCPNCGTQNDENNAKCQKCGFSIKGAANPKFKGTMLMMNAPPELAQRLPSPAVSAPLPTGPAPSPVGPVPSRVGPAPFPVGPMPAGAFPKKSLAKATMIGVAPPSPGAVAPPAAKPESKTAAIGQVAAPAPKPMTSPLKAPASIPRPAPSSAPPRPGPAQPVNPFGGTMLMGAVPMQEAGSTAGTAPGGPKQQGSVPPAQSSDRTISSPGAPSAASQEQLPDLNTTTPSVAPPTPATTPKTLNDMPTVASPSGAPPEPVADIPAPPFLVSDSGNLAEAATVPAPAGTATQPEQEPSFELDVPMNSRSPVLGVILGILTLGIYWLVKWWGGRRSTKPRADDL